LHAAARLERCGLTRYFDVVVTPDVTGERKPAPTNFLYALDRLGAGPTNAAMVGDSLRRDIEPANRLGLLSVHAAYGDWNPGYACTPDRRLAAIAALPSILFG
ncbi:MAG: HAD family hydrolase, partial [Methanospirillum sp.]